MKPEAKVSNKAALKTGTDIELEHTGNEKEARVIASHHIKEHKNYYDKKVGLPAMEKKLESMEKKMEKKASSEYLEEIKKEAFLDELKKIAACASHKGKPKSKKKKAKY